MTWLRAQSSWTKVFELARKQHGVVEREQLRALGLSASTIDHALSAERLHPTQWRAVYVVGRPGLSSHARLQAALLSRGEAATLSDGTAGGLWRIWKPGDREIHISLPAACTARSRAGIKVHRRDLARAEVTHHWGLRVTSPLRTVIDLAAKCDRPQAERLINAADARNVLRADVLSRCLTDYHGRPGVPLLSAIFHEHEFVLTQSEIERLFPPLAVKAGLGPPDSQRRLGRGRVDFWFERYRLVVECDSLRYHRTTLQQHEDRARDHTHFRARRSYLRFTAYQIKHDPNYVVELLSDVRLRDPAASYTRRR